jgi:hypothetical protein
MSEKRIFKYAQVRIPQPDLDQVEAFRRAQPIKPTMGATVMHLTRLGLKAANTKPSSKDAA